MLLPSWLADFGNYSIDEKADFSNDTVNAKKAEMVILSGNDSVKYSSGKLSATEEGTATVMFRLAYTLVTGQTAYVYSQPITINVKTATDTENQTEQTTDAPTVDNGTDTDITEESGCGSTLSAPVIAIAVMTLGMGITFGKKRD